jgi:5S rRNA maturation endonuclease (ribonuclease M5)
MNPSLSIGEGRDGRVLATCHRGNPCSLDEICKAMGITANDLFPDKDEVEVKVPVKAEKLNKNLALVATYDYRDELGELLFQKQRFVDENGKKTFRQRKPDGEGGWTYQLGEVPRVLYRLPQVVNAIANGKSIWVVEGEKDADTLVEAGYEATTMPNGAGTWLEIHTEAVAGANIFLISDNDEVGQKHALDVAETLRQAGCKVKIGIPPEGYKDITDLYEDGKSVKNLIPFEVDEPAQQDDEPDQMEELLSGLEVLLRRDDISEESRLARAGILLNTFSRGAEVDYGRLVHWEDFLLEEDDDSYDWVIPGVLEKQERVIVVAAEGVGKTMLARQVAICASAGINPFTMSKMEPIRTLTVDLENPERIIRRTSRNIMNASRTLGHSQRNLAELLCKPSGLDLLKQSDRAVLEKAIEEAKPQLLVMGPLYKAFLDPGGRTSESIAIEVAKYLDGLRDAYGCAMWLEHHAPLGSSMGSRDLRPFGSAVWSRWPEFGLSLTPDPTATEGFVYNVSHFRGARDRRKFPTKMRRGKVFPFEVLEFMKVDE